MSYTYTLSYTHTHQFITKIIITSVDALQPKTTRTHLQLNKVGLLLVALSENTYYGEPWGVSISGYSKEPIYDLGFSWVI